MAMTGYFGFTGRVITMAGLLLVAAVLTPQAWGGASGRSIYIVITQDAPIGAHERAQRTARLAEADRRLQKIATRIGEAIGRRAEIVRRYRFVLTGMAMRLSEDEAGTVANMDGVRSVYRDIELDLQRRPDERRVAVASRSAQRQDRGEQLPDPVTALIGATGVWDGSATGLPGTMGEGQIIGVVGTGINGSHPSFAAQGDDGYLHINPLGAGNYLGECVSQSERCNAKLIGRWTFVSQPGVGVNSEDEDGYSTFVAAQAAGNLLFDVDVTIGVGTSAPVTLDTVAGVAPHASLIAYRICAPTCLTSDAIAALDQAISDGVDVLVYSAGTGSQSPWEGIFGFMFRVLRDTGIFVVYTAGSGSTTQHGTMALAGAGPWVASFTTGSHARDWSLRELGDFTGGDGVSPPSLSGRSRTGGVTAPIIDAADVPIPDVPTADLAQCLVPLPEGSVAGAIVLCDRGQIPRIQKSIHVQSGGAAGMVLANVAGDLTSIAADIHAIPSIHINAQDAQSLRDWLANGSGHGATIAVAQNLHDDERADLLGAFNARGPNLGLSYLAPSLSAPAMEVTTAFAAPLQFATLTGRGSAPGAGAVALLKALHPDWSDAEILSALMTTAFTGMREEVTLLPTDALGHGGGRIDIPAAARATLVLDATDAQFVAADPATGGKPERINLAGLVNVECVGLCSWTRQVKSTREGAWTVVAMTQEADLQLSVEPASFALAKGEQQQISVTASGVDIDNDGYRFGQIVLTPDTTDGAPPSVLQLVVNLLADSDGDGVADVGDNCTEIANPLQRDSNGDGFGNLCDADLNNDDITNVVDLGLFRLRFGSDDADADFDGDGLVGNTDLAILGQLIYAPPGPAGDLASSNQNRL